MDFCADCLCPDQTFNCTDAPGCMLPAGIVIFAPLAGSLTLTSAVADAVAVSWKVTVPAGGKDEELLAFAPAPAQERQVRTVRS